mmetsp:Transcript_29297/g.53162  ORF Transcript_29297/g.53162 Transcript_29297/m.53162 type:complete len:128 (-) Transcript_29297:92-475(-)
MLTLRLLAGLMVATAVRPELSSDNAPDDCEKAIFVFINGHVTGAIELEEWFGAFQKMDDDEKTDHTVSLEEFTRHMTCKEDSDEAKVFQKVAGDDNVLTMEEWAAAYKKVDADKDYAVTLAEIDKLS